MANQTTISQSNSTLVVTRTPNGGSSYNVADGLPYFNPAQLPDLSGVYDPTLPARGGVTYNTDGSVATDENGVAFTYNVDGTVHTISKGGVTRTATYNADGTIGSWA